MGCSQSSKKAAKPEVVTAGKAEETKPGAGGEASASLKPGDQVSVSQDGGFEGEIVKCTTTDVLVKGSDGQERWCEAEDVRKSASAPGTPSQLQVQVGQVVSTCGGLKGTVTKRTTTDVCLKTEAGEEVWVGCEDITFLDVWIEGAVSIRNADYVGKSDPFCVCQLEGKPESKVQTEIVSNNLDPLWNYEAKMASYVSGDVLTFEIYDKDVAVKKDDFLGRAKLTSEQISSGGFFGDLPLEDESGNAAKGTLRVKVRLMNELSQPEAEPLAKGAVVEELTAPAGAQKKGCCW